MPILDLRARLDRLAPRLAGREHPRPVRILVPRADGSPDPDVYPITEAEARTRGRLWIPDEDARPEPDAFPEPR